MHIQSNSNLGYGLSISEHMLQNADLITAEHRKPWQIPSAFDAPPVLIRTPQAHDNPPFIVRPSHPEAPKAAVTDDMFFRVLLDDKPALTAQTKRKRSVSFAPQTPAYESPAYESIAKRQRQYSTGSESNVF